MEGVGLVDDAVFVRYGLDVILPGSLGDQLLEHVVHSRFIGVDPDGDGNVLAWRMREGLECAAKCDDRPFGLQRPSVFVDGLKHLVTLFPHDAPHDGIGAGREFIDDGRDQQLAVFVGLFKVDIRGGDGVLRNLRLPAASCDDQRKDGETC